MSDFDLNEFLENLPSDPGVYQMFSADNTVIYVGKARDLSKRVSSYFKGGDKSAKTTHMLKHIGHIELTITDSENDALLLESDLIKQLKPRYNVLLRDDKSYPYIYISSKHKFPRLDIHRGTKREKGQYFGPYPSATAVRETLNLLQKLFLIRPCKDSFFNARSRPCLQYQIGRCSAPCVDYIDQESYQQSILRASLFLQGKAQQIIDEIGIEMQQASDDLNFEKAANLRDLIASLRKIQQQQYISQTDGNIDVIAVAVHKGVVCVNILFIRAGRIIGNKFYFPKVPKQISSEEVLAEFLPQYYTNSARGGQCPETIITNIKLPEQQWFENFLTELQQKKVSIQTSVRTSKAQWLKLALNNANAMIKSQLASKANIYQQFQELQSLLKLDQTPQRIECFDISHTNGEATVASCVVFNENGPVKSDYRRFNITDITGGDDYAAMAQALSRRYRRAKQADALLPDILLIDGGKGQVNKAAKVIEELQMSELLIVGIAKGEGRKAIYDRLFLVGDKHDIAIPEHSSAMHLIQQVRDEAHRFAITGHRQRRAKSRSTSSLEHIEGVGAKRRQQLLRQFGGLQELRNASAAEIAKVPGISSTIAQRIYDALH